VNVATGIATVEPELEDVMKTLKASKLDILWNVSLPRAMPYFFASLKVAIALAFVGSVVAETVASNRGIGNMMMIASSSFNVPLVFAGLFLAVAGIGFTGPNAMALAMSEQGARAGTASAIMGSMQFSCGLIGGLMLNVLIWDALLNMGSVMLLFILIGGSAMYIMHRERKLKTA
jgi:hypothetical protein